MNEIKQREMIQEQEDQSYKQELGLKKMLYKYENENQQLKAQIKALTERLADIMAKKEQPTEVQPTLQQADQFRLNGLRQEMKRFYSEIQKVTTEIKKNKELINEFQELRCVQLTNQVRKEQKYIESCKQKLKKYEKMQQMKGFSIQELDLKQSAFRINSNGDRLRQIQQQLDKTRKHIRELQKTRDHHDRQQIKRHSYAITLNTKIRQIQNIGKQAPPVQDHSKQKKGIWNLDYTEENYQIIKNQLNELKKQKQRIMNSLKNENIVLKNRFAQLSLEAEQLNKSIHLPQIEPIRNSSKKHAKVPNDSLIKLSSSINQSRVNSPPRLLHIGPSEFERNNDKNYSPKKLRRIQWQSANHRTSGIEWNDAHLRSPISGINFWFDNSLVGLQLLQRMGQSTQHLHLTQKSVSPVQYRLNSNDYVQNIILWISDNKIVGIQLTSKNGRNDGFGSRGKGRKFDFQIKEPEKPVFSFGKFRVNNNVSEIIKLGFQVV